MKRQPGLVEDLVGSLIKIPKGSHHILRRWLDPNYLLRRYLEP